MPKSIGSRSSIQSILNDALSKEIFIKMQSNKDKRIKNYFLSDYYVDIINKWLENEHQLFTSSNGQL